MEQAKQSEFRLKASSSCQPSVRKSKDRQGCIESRRHHTPTSKQQILFAKSSQVLVTQLRVRSAQTTHRDWKLDSYWSYGFLLSARTTTITRLRPSDLPSGNARSATRVGFLVLRYSCQGEYHYVPSRACRFDESKTRLFKSWDESHKSITR